MRPQSQHRLSASSTSSSNFPIRHQASRHHSHSVSLGTVNPTHRVTRRKSMTSTAASSAAAIAAAIGSSDQTSSHSHRRSLNLKSASSRGTETTHTGRSGNVGSIHTDTGAAKNDEDFLEEDDFMREVPIGRNSMAHGESQEGPSTARARRASEGAPLTRPEGKRASGDLKCEKCGKEYKHGSCLTKHLLVSLTFLSWTPSNGFCNSYLQCTEHVAGGFFFRLLTYEWLAGGSIHLSGLTPRNFSFPNISKYNCLKLLRFLSE